MRQARRSSAITIYIASASNVQFIYNLSTMNLSQRLSLLSLISLVASTISTAAIASGNVSDIGGGNVSDIGGGNVSDIGGGNVSDNGGGNVSDNGGGNVSDSASHEQLAADLATAYESCRGGAGCDTFYELYEQALDLLE